MLAGERDLVLRPEEDLIVGRPGGHGTGDMAMTATEIVEQPDVDLESLAVAGAVPSTGEEQAVFLRQRRIRERRDTSSAARRDVDAFENLALE